MKDLGKLDFAPKEAEIFERLLVFIKENPETIGFALRWDEPGRENRFVTYDRSRCFSMATSHDGMTLYHDLSLGGIVAISKGEDPSNHATIQIIHAGNSSPI